MNPIVQILMERDGLSYREAQIRLQEARDMLDDEGDDPEEILQNEFGLESDYVFDLIDF